MVIVSPSFAELSEGVELEGLEMYTEVDELSVPRVDCSLVVEGRPVKGVV